MIEMLIEPITELTISRASERMLGTVKML